MLCHLKCCGWIWRISSIDKWKNELFIEHRFRLSAATVCLAVAWQSVIGHVFKVCNHCPRRHRQLTQLWLKWLTDSNWEELIVCRTYSNCVDREHWPGSGCQTHMSAFLTAWEQNLAFATENCSFLLSSLSHSQTHSFSVVSQFLYFLFPMHSIAIGLECIGKLRKTAKSLCTLNNAWRHRHPIRNETEQSRNREKTVETENATREFCVWIFSKPQNNCNNVVLRCSFCLSIPVPNTQAHIKITYLRLFE